MAVDFAKSQKAPELPIILGGDFMYAFKRFTDVYGGKSISQASLKALQVLPLVWSALSVKEAQKMSKADRNMAASRCMQEIAVPGLIMLLERAIEESDERPRMPHKWKDRIYYTTLGTGRPRKSASYGVMFAFLSFASRKPLSWAPALT